MGNKTRWLLGLCCLILVGGAGLMLFNRREERKNEQDLVRMATATAKEIKNTFADVKEIEFSESYTKNGLAGITAVAVTISTTYGLVSDIAVSMVLTNKADIWSLMLVELNLRKA